MRQRVFAVGLLCAAGLASLASLSSCTVEADVQLDLGFISGISCAEKGACDPGFLCFHEWCVGEGSLRFSLSFQVDSDFDLHVVTPAGHHIFWNFREADGGILDVDQCVESCGAGQHVENVYFESDPPDGTYEVYVRNYSGGGTDPRAAGPFVVEIAGGDQLATLTGQLAAVEGSESQHFTFEWPSFQTGIAGGAGGGGAGGAATGGAGGG